MTVLALDFGGTEIKVGRVARGRVEALRRTPCTSSQADLSAVLTVAHTLLEGVERSEVVGVGLSVPTVVNSKLGTVRGTNGDKYRYLAEIDLPQWVKHHFDLPWVLENDARAALLGEVYAGVAQGERDVVIMTLGTGVGSAALIGGELLVGSHGQAGILGGHFTVEQDGYPCPCGNRGCLEAMVGTWNMPTLARAHPEFATSSLVQADLLDFRAFTDAARAGDRVAQQLVERLRGYWASGLINLIHAYDAEVAVLSGGLTQSADLFETPLRDEVQRRAWTSWGTPRVLISPHARTSALLGLEYLLRRAQGLPLEVNP